MNHHVTTDPSIDQKVAYLRTPGSYPFPVEDVETVETHMAWVFLAGPYAYKMKKPVERDFLDFSTLEARRRNGLDEVRLNRRLAGDVYIGLVPLTANDEGELELEGAGTPIEWLVKMKRLPADRMLDRLLRERVVEADELRQVAELLATFYHHTPPEKLPPSTYLARRTKDVEDNARVLCQPRYGLPPELVDHVVGAQKTFLEQSGHLLEARAAEGHILEAHGDLRPEHICLLPNPVIFDCLEFNRSFRIIDAVDELSFLSMECEHLGAPYVQEILFDTYVRITADRPPPRLVSYYKSYRAALRAKLAVWHLKEDGGADPGTWIPKAIRYLQLAERCLPPG